MTLPGGSYSEPVSAVKISGYTQRGVTAKLKKRIASGVCPCCKRSFKDLHRHMAGQHPDFAGVVDVA